MMKCTSSFWVSLRKGYNHSKKKNASSYFVVFKNLINFNIPYKKWGFRKSYKGWMINACFLSYLKEHFFSFMKCITGKYFPLLFLVYGEIKNISYNVGGIKLHSLNIPYLVNNSSLFIIRQKN